MPLFRATTAVRGEAAAHVLGAALEDLDPAPLASEIHDHDDGSGLWDVGALFGAEPDGVALALAARVPAGLGMPRPYRLDLGSTLHARVVLEMRRHHAQRPPGSGPAQPG